MKRTLWMVLLGTSVLMNAEAEAQRPGARNHQRNVAPQRSARLADCRAPSGGRAYACRAAPDSRVVYRYVRGPVVATAPLWVSPTWAHARVRLVWRGGRRGEVGQPWLRDALGPMMVRRVHDHGREAGLHGPVRGHWLEGRQRGSVLVLTMNGQEVARLVDFDDDGDVDAFRLRNFRRS